MPAITVILQCPHGHMWDLPVKRSSVGEYVGGPPICRQCPPDPPVFPATITISVERPAVVEITSDGKPSRIGGA